MSKQERARCSAVVRAGGTFDCIAVNGSDDVHGLDFVAIDGHHVLADETLRGGDVAIGVGLRAREGDGAGGNLVRGVDVHRRRHGALVVGKVDGFDSAVNRIGVSRGGVRGAKVNRERPIRYGHAFLLPIQVHSTC